jgi:arylsulfatase A-like enzyme
MTGAWALLAVVGLLAGPAAVSAADKPNFVVIFADDLGYGDLATFGHPTIATPHLDQMAREGQKWTQFYAAAPICTPSRAALLTGQVPPRTGVDPGVYFSHDDGGMPGDAVTIAERLKTAGYATAHVGKWHLGHTKGHRPTDQGFDQYFGVPYSNDMAVDPEMPVAEDISFRKGMTLDKMRNPDNKKKDWVPLMKNEKVIEYPANQATLTRRYTDQCQNFIREQADSDQPFFLYMAHTFPHIPLRSAEPWKGKSRRGAYGDVVEELDHSVGQILKTLRERGVAEDTLVIFTSDNGPWLTKGKRGGTSGLLRDGKGSTFEGGMREPTIFWWPSHLDKGVVRELGSTLDLMPTFCDLAGIDPPDRTLDGQSLKPALLGTGPSPRETMFYYNGRGDLFAVRHGPYKLHFVVQGGFGVPPKKHTPDPPRLHHLGHDPREKFNVADEHPGVVKELQQIAEQHRKSLGQ